MNEKAIKRLYKNRRSLVELHGILANNGNPFLLSPGVILIRLGSLNVDFVVQHQKRILLTQHIVIE